MLTRKIKGDKTFEHIVAANIAIDGHISRHGENSMFGKVFIHEVPYRGKTHVVEVIAYRTQITATVMAGKRSLNRVCNH